MQHPPSSSPPHLEPVPDRPDNVSRSLRATQLALNWLVAAGIVLYLVKELVTTGLGLDGLVYANLAKLLAADVGSFWHLPRYDGSGPFREHLPLGIWLLSGWMRTAGDAFWSEKAYSALMALGIFGMTAVLWRNLTGRFDYWWPWLLLALMPVSTFTLKNNYLESPLTFFALLSIWAALKASRLHQNYTATGCYLLLGGAFCIAAGMSKGPAGLFVLTAPGIFYLARVLENESEHIGLTRAGIHALILTLLVTGLVVIGLYGLFSTADANAALTDWWRQQLLPSISGDRPGVHDRAYLLGELLRNLLIPTVIVTVVAWRQRSRPSAMAIALLALAVAASLPLLVSGRQFRYYLLPSLPLYALGLALITQPEIRARLRPAAIAAVAVGLGIFTLTRGVVLFGSNSKDQFEIDVAAAVSTRVATRLPVSFCSDADYYTLKAYLFRNHNIESRSGVADSRSETRISGTICSKPSGSNPDQLARGHYFTPHHAPTASQPR